MNDDWWNSRLYLKIKLTTTVNIESCEHLGRKTKSILTNRHTSRLAVDIHTQRGAHQIKYKMLYSAVTEIKKYIK